MIPTDPSRQIMALFLVAAFFAAVFAVWPRFDLWVTGLFFDSVRGFSIVDEGLLNAIRLVIWRLSEAMLVAAVLACLVGLWTRADVLAVPRRVWAFILGLYILAPGLLVDAILKPLWGRARPADVAEFGGTLLFTPPFQLAHQCTRNCSFVAGEMAGAVALSVALMMILQSWNAPLSRRARRMAWAAILALPVYSGFQRIAAGRHFLSDVIFATLVVLIVAAALHAVLFRRRVS